MDFDNCSEDEISLKSTFLGPQAENSDWVLKEIHDIFFEWFKWRRSRFPKDGSAVSYSNFEMEEFSNRRQVMATKILELSKRFENEIPKFSPRYIGHMFSEISLPALFGHVMALLHNPNNISGESSRVGTQIEDEAIHELAQMVGFSNDAAGHFTSGGTIANFEAIYRAKMRAGLWFSAQAQVSHNMKPFLWTACGWPEFESATKKLTSGYNDDFNFSTHGWNSFSKKVYEKFKTHMQDPVILVPESKHYSWIKGAELFGLGAESVRYIKLDDRGKISIKNLNETIQSCIESETPILMVVSILGTTELGIIDDIHEINDLLKKYKREFGFDIWHHVDGAYGGYFCTLKGSKDLPDNKLNLSAHKALEAVSEVTSITIDPHKLGFVPYASGTFICNEKRNYFIKSIGAPYVNFNIHKDKGPFTIEGSRSATGAVATWLTAKSVGFDRNGYGRILNRTIALRAKMEDALRNADLPIYIYPNNETNILCFSVCLKDQKLSENNKVTRELYDFLPSGNNPFYVSKTKLDNKKYKFVFEQFANSCQGQDADEIEFIRIVIMNPFFKSKEMNVDLEDEFINKLKLFLSGSVKW